MGTPIEPDDPPVTKTPLACCEPTWIHQYFCDEIPEFVWFWCENWPNCSAGINCLYVLDYFIDMGLNFCLCYYNCEIDLCCIKT